MDAIQDPHPCSITAGYESTVARSVKVLGLPLTSQRVAKRLDEMLCIQDELEFVMKEEKIAGRLDKVSGKIREILHELDEVRKVLGEMRQETKDDIDWVKNLRDPTGDLVRKVMKSHE